MTYMHFIRTEILFEMFYKISIHIKIQSII